MIKMGDKPKKAFLSAHIIFSVVWIGTAICSLILVLTLDEGLETVSDILKTFFLALLLPSAIGSIKTGLLLSIFTHWGLVKYYWVMVKWLVSASMMAWLTLFVGNWVLLDANASMLNENMLVVGFGVQIVLLLLLVVVSVFKPWGKVSKADSLRREAHLK